ncbi:MAG: hypothetical protein M0Z93_07265 [Actinomycetota bacterium]|nr:hypothetical protein [Actinomycetota bacterium]
MRRPRSLRHPDPTRPRAISSRIPHIPRIPTGPVRRRSGIPLVLGACLAVCLTACAPVDTGYSPSGTTDVYHATTMYSVNGPYAAGTARYTMPDGDQIQVWYPVAPSAVVGKATYTYTIKSWLPASLADNPVLAKLPDAVPTDSYLDAPIDTSTAASGDPAGKYPVVLFNEGFGSYPQQSTFLTDHLATWGFVVAAPNDPSTDLEAVLTGKATPSVAADLPYLDAALAYLQTQARTPGSRFYHLLDFTKVGVVGHSLGGGAAITMAGNPLVKTYAALAPAPGSVPTTHKPGLVMYGTADTIVPPPSVRSLYARLPTPKRLIAIDGAGHNVFDDICTIHSGTHRLASDLRALGSAGGGLAELSTLATNGCFAPDVDPTLAWPLIEQAVTAQMRYGLGIDHTSAGLSAGLDHAFPGVTATYSQDP